MSDAANSNPSIGELLERIAALEQELAQSQANLQALQAQTNPQTLATEATPQRDRQPQGPATDWPISITKTTLALVFITRLEDGMLLDASHSFYQLTGYTPAEIHHQTTRSLNFWVEAAAYAQFGQRLQAKEQVENYEIQFQLQSGEVRVGLLSGRVFHQEETPCIVNVLRDVTTLKQAIATLDASKGDFQSLANPVDQLVLVRSGATGSFLYVSSTYEAIWGQSCTSLYQNSEAWLAAIHPSDLPIVTRSLDEQATHQPTSREYRIIHPDGSIRWIAVQIQPMGTPTEQPSYIIGYATDITRQKHQAQYLRQHEQIMSATTDALAVIDINYVYRLVNQAYLDLHQKRREEVIDQPVATLFEPAFFQTVIQPLLARCFAGSVVRYQHWVPLPDGGHCLAEITYTPYREAGAIAGSLVTVRDLTTFHQTEEILAQRQRDLSLVLQAVAIGLWQLDLATGDLITSEQCKVHFGLSPEAELSFQTVFEIIHPDDRARVQRAVNDAIAHRQAYEIEYQVIWPNSEVHWLFATGHVVYDEAGNSIAMDGITLDISDRKRIETTIQQQAQQEQALNRVVQVIRQSLDLATIFTTAAREVAELLHLGEVAIVQYYPDEACWRHVAAYRRDFRLPNRTHEEIPDRDNPLAERLKQREFVLIENAASLTDPTNEALAQDSPGSWLLMPLVVNNTVWGSLSSIKFPEPVSYTGTEIELIQRIADQVAIAIHQAQLYTQLQASEIRFQHLVANLPGTIFRYVIRPDGTSYVAYISPNAHQIWGVDKARIEQDVSVLWQQIIPEDAARLHQILHQAEQTKTPWQAECRVLNPDGQYRWLQGIAQPTELENGELAWDGVTLDISDRKTTELALQASEQQVCRILDSISDGFLTLDQDWRFVYLNDKAELLLRRRREDLLGQRAWDEFPEAIDSRMYYQYHWAVAHQQSVAFEVYYPALATWFEIFAYPFAEGLSVSFRDITQIKLAEQELNRLNNALSHAVEGISQLNQQGYYQMVNQAYAHLTGYTPDELIGLPWQATVHPDDHDRLAIAFQTMLQQGSVEVEAKGIRKDGTVFYKQVMMIAEYKTTEDTGQHEFIGHFCFMKDISDRKAAELALQQQRDRERLLSTITRRIRQSLNLNYILNTTVHEVRRFLQTDRVVLYQMSDSESYRIIEESVAPGCQALIGQEINDPCFAATYIEQYFQGRVRCISDIDTEDINPCHADFLRQFGVRANLVVPIRQHRNLWGLLIAHHCQGPRQWSTADIDLLKQLSEQVSIALQQANLYQQAKLELKIRKQAEADLQQLNQHLEQRVQERTGQLIARTTELEALFQAIPDLVFTLTTAGIFLDCKTPNYPYLYRPLPAVIGRSIDDVLPTAVATIITTAIATTITTQSLTRVEYPLRIDGTERFFEARLMPLSTEQVMVIIRDVTEQKRAETAMRKQASRETLLRAITQRIRQSLNLDEVLATAVTEVREILQCDRALILYFTSESSATILQESVAPGFPSLTLYYRHDDCFPKTCQQTYQAGQIRSLTQPALMEENPCLVEFLQEMQIQSKLSAPILLQEATRPTPEFPPQRLWGLLSIHSCTTVRQWTADEQELVQQIAAQLAIAIQQSELYTQLQQELQERAIVEAQLRTSLEEKDVLLKEVHHRVKNNMQMVSSLLSLQAGAIDDPAILKLFNDSRSRVRTMALIHERLYQSNNLAQINTAAYFRDLGEDVLQSHLASTQQIQLRLNVSELEVTLEVALPCGLIANELILNAIKYAFPDQRPGEIILHFGLSADHYYYLVIEDNGIGIPQTEQETMTNFQSNPSLGLQLVHGLTQQLGGTLRLGYQNVATQSGTRFTITFKQTT